MSDQATHLRGLMQRPSSADGVPARFGEGAFDHDIETMIPSSVSTGVVSYGPICSTGRSAGAAPAHHRIHHRSISTRRRKLARAIAICSGKGGVGKSNLAVNLAAAMSAKGLRVCLLDADLGLANADVLCSLSPRLTLEQVVAGECRLKDAMMLAPGGFRLIPGCSGVAGMADLPPSQRRLLLNQLSALERVADVILIDCGAGISESVLNFAAAAHAVLVVTTPDPTAMTDGYSMIKQLSAIDEAVQFGTRGLGIESMAVQRKTQDSCLKTQAVTLAVNMAADETEGLAVFGRINRVSRLFLNRNVQYGGTIPLDSAVVRAVRQRMPFVLHSPDSDAARAIGRMAAKFAPLGGRAGHGASSIEAESQIDSSTSPGFFARIAVWLGMAEFAE